jgi:hypothetical protein
MSASSSEFPASDGTGLQSVEELNDFKLVSPGAAVGESRRPRSSALPFKALGPSTPEAAERVNAAIVIVLTLACTALSFFDLFLLASGS